MKYATPLSEFYAQIKTDNPHIATDRLGHFNVFEIEKMRKQYQIKLPQDEPS